MFNSQIVAGSVVLLIVTGAFALQQRSIQRVSAEVAELKRQIETTTAAGASSRSEEPFAMRTWSSSSEDLAAQQRLAELERAVAQLARASDYLMERGQLPLGTNKLEDLVNKLADASAGERDRLAALRLLRRNRALNDESVYHALNLLQGATNAGVREDVLEQLEGLTNAALRTPLLALAAADPAGDVREKAVENLRRFSDDPQVAAQLWQSALSDKEGDVREEAREALIEGPKSEGQLTALRERALNSNSSVEERALAWRALREARQSDPNVSASLAQLALTTQDPNERIQLYRAFDDSKDPTFIPALVQGLQDQNPFVRERAVDGLSDHKDHTGIQQWLGHLAQNDPDPAVRREAFRVLNLRRN